MKRSHLILIMVAVIAFSYWLIDFTSSYFIGVDVPFVGPVGVEPFSFLADFGVIVGGSVVVFVYILFGRNTK